MKIPLVDLRAQHKLLGRDINRAFKRIFDSSSFIKGPLLAEFEKSFAQFIGVKYSIGVASGTDALHLCLMALNVVEGDEVILPVNTFIATVYAILYVGAKPVFIDVNPETYNIDVNLLRRKITKKTKVLLPVHLYGQPAEMDNIMSLAKKHNLAVIEDVSQAHGAIYKKKRVGSLGTLAAFSLYPSKNLGACGDAGVIAVNSSKLATRLLALREYGRSSKYFYNEIGLNSRLDSLQAAILLIKLKHLDRWNAKRRRVANYYTKKLSKEIPTIITPKVISGVDAVYYTYAIRVRNRDQLGKYLESLGVQTAIHYPLPLHLQKSLSSLGYKKGDFPAAEQVTPEILSLPIYPELTIAQQDYIIDTIKKFYEKN